MNPVENVEILEKILLGLYFATIVVVKEAQAMMV